MKPLLAFGLGFLAALIVVSPPVRSAVFTFLAVLTGTLFDYLRVMLWG